MAKKTDSRVYFFMFFGAAILCFAIYWMYTDTVKSGNISQAQRIRRSAVVAHNPATPEMFNNDSVFKEMLDNPLQLKGAHKSVAEVSMPLSCIPSSGVASSSQIKDNFYADTK